MRLISVTIEVNSKVQCLFFNIFKQPSENIIITKSKFKSTTFIFEYFQKTSKNMALVEQSF